MPVGIAVPAANLSGVSVTTSPDDAASLSVTTTSTTGAFTIPAGALWAIIRNAGFIEAGDLETNATIAGASWTPGREEKWEAYRDTVNGELKTLPEITGNGNGARVFITYAS